MDEWNVSKEECGAKLLVFLSQRLGAEYSSRQLKRAIEKNRCQINYRVERFASFQLGTGDHVSIDLTDFQKPSLFTFEKARTLYEDDFLFIYNKPAGINCDVQGIVKVLESDRPDLRLVHRLDQDTTGVLLLAKNLEAEAVLLEQFKQCQIRKCYLAIVDGIPSKNAGTIENALGKKMVYQGQTIWGVVDKSKGLYAYTDWKCLGTGVSASLFQCIPKTGRTHQIRVHMAFIGHPLLGDFQYGKHFRCKYQAKRYLLHAYEVELIHPQTKKRMQIRAPIPDDFEKAQRELGIHPTSC